MAKTIKKSKAYKILIKTKKENSSIKNSLTDSNENDLYLSEFQNYKNKKIIDKLRKLLNENNISNNYNSRLIKLFTNFLNYVAKTRSNFYENKRIKISYINEYINNNNKYKSPNTKYYIFYKLRKIITMINGEKESKATNKVIRKKRNEQIKIKKNEIYLIINFLKETEDVQNLCIFYFLYIKGLNFYGISRILLSDFKNGFSLLIIKKGKKAKYKIHPYIRGKLFEILKNTTYKSKFFFYNEVKETKSMTRVIFFKQTFGNIIDNLPKISDERKQKLLKYFSSNRNSKINFEKNMFDCNMQYTLGFFDKRKSPLSSPKKINSCNVSPDNDNYFKKNLLSSFEEKDLGESKESDIIGSIYSFEKTK